MSAVLRWCSQDGQGQAAGERCGPSRRCANEEEEPELGKDQGQVAKRGFCDQAEARVLESE
jgi:hypothetical protein